MRHGPWIPFESLVHVYSLSIYSFTRSVMNIYYIFSTFFACYIVLKKNYNLYTCLLSLLASCFNLSTVRDFFQVNLAPLHMQTKKPNLAYALVIVTFLYPTVFRNRVHRITLVAVQGTMIFQPRRGRCPNNQQ